MNVTNSIVDFFQGSPFHNPVGSLIERATDSRNEGENWTLFMEVCDVINSMEDGPKLAIRAIKRRISTEMSRENTTTLYTLTLLETCVKNCGYRFHLVVCSRDFLQEFEKTILNNFNVHMSKADIPIVVLNKMLYLIQMWYDSFKGQPDLKEIELLYMYLLECGIKFPMTDLNTMSPINTPKKRVETPKQESIKSVNGDNSLIVTTPDSPAAASKKQLSISSETIINKLSKDLQTVQTNLDIMCELMNEYSLTERIPDDALSLLKNLYEINSEMQKRILQLINKWEETQIRESSVLFDMLRINDEMNSALAQYGRFERAIAGINKSEENNDLKTRISRSNVSDIFCAQRETENFSDGLMKATKSTKVDQKMISQFPEEGEGLIPVENTTPKSTPGVLTSQEFDRFLSEQADNSYSLNSDCPNNFNSSRNDRQNPLAAKPKSESSQLFDL